MSPPPSSPLSPSDLIFPSSHHTSISSTLTSLKRSNLSLPNRLHSIKHDVDFVQKVSEAYDLPLIANERCGSWYIPPASKAGSAYFKSTDGHHGQWSFSLRRLNLQVLELIGTRGGCIIVDSTRRGKSMPDALSKTVPIWICVLSHLLFPELPESMHELKTPGDVVSRSEHAQIGARTPSFVEEVKKLGLDVASLRAKLLGKAMEPVWVTPDSMLPIKPQVSADKHLVVLCTASGSTSSSDHGSFDYVQGAADDSESWALGLDAITFWTHSEKLLSTPGDELPMVIEAIASDSHRVGDVMVPTLIKPTRNIWVGNNSAAETLSSDFDIVVSCSQSPNDKLARKLEEKYIHLKCSTGKIGSRHLRAQLPKLSRLSDLLISQSKMLVSCPTGRDIAVGTALAIICLFCAADGSLSPVEGSFGWSKALVKQRLSWIMVAMPETAAPSRATLQSVNAFLLSES